MPTQHCTCGAKYRFADAAVGKRAKCKKCGTILTLSGEDDLGPIPLADDGMMDEFAAAAERAQVARAPNPGGNAGASPVPTSYLPSSESAGRLGPVVVEETSHRTFAQDVVRAVLFPVSVRNGLLFAMLWVLLFLAELFFAGSAFGFGIISILRFGVYVGVVGWWAAYRFNTIASAAGGDHELPGLGGIDDYWDDIALPLFRWIGSWAVVLIPAIAYWTFASAVGWVTSISAFVLLEDGLGGVFKNADAATAPMVGLVLLGLFWWPIVALCVALGGFGCLARLDLIITTVLRTLPFYIIAVMLVVAAEAMSAVLSSQIAERFAAGEDAEIGSRFSARLVIGFLAIGVEMYFELVAMQVIGLYYHHFKGRFAWDWG